MARKKKSEASKSGAVEGFKFNYGNVVDEVSKKFTLGAGELSESVRRSSCVSTGLLVSDLILSGGIYPGGWYTLLGGEQSAKSTHMMKIAVESRRSKANIIQFWDYEGSMDPAYMERMAKGNVDIQSLFGVRNPKTGDWEIPPAVDYQSTSEGEKFYNAVGGLLRRLPDKVFMNGNWFLVFDNTKENMSRLKGKYSAKLKTKTGRLYVEAEDGSMQALILLDSYPAMTPESMDDDDSSKALAVEARMHSALISKVKGKLRRKHSTVVGVNQVRLNPGERFGNPEYEPCGQALKFNSDARIKQTARAVPQWKGGKGQLEEEMSVTGGTDVYRYIHMRAIKNKLGTPYLEGWYRIWVSDSEGVGRGFCPVWDTFEYLRATGQISGQMRKLYLETPWITVEKLTFMDFKRLILLEGKALKEHCKSLGISSNPKIRERCFKQLKSGEGMKYYFEMLRGEQSDEEEDED